MDTIYHTTERIQRSSEELLHNTQLMKKYQDECGFDRFVSTVRKGARVTSSIFFCIGSCCFRSKNLSHHITHTIKQPSMIAHSIYHRWLLVFCSE